MNRFSERKRSAEITPKQNVSHKTADLSGASDCIGRMFWHIRTHRACSWFTCRWWSIRFARKHAFDISRRESTLVGAKTTTNSSSFVRKLGTDIILKGIFNTQSYLPFRPNRPPIESGEANKKVISTNRWFRFEIDLLCRISMPDRTTSHVICIGLNYWSSRTMFVLIPIRFPVNWHLFISCFHTKCTPIMNWLRIPVKWKKIKAKKIRTQTDGQLSTEYEKENHL